MCVFTLCFYVFLFFFFSSRRRHTRFDCDWSSDVCSSDLVSKHRGDASMTQPLQQVSRRGLSVSKDDRFGGPFGEQTFQRVSFGIARRRARQQPAQSREDAPIAREWPWTTSPVIEQQGEQDELNVGLGGARKAALKLLRRQRAPLGGGASREIEIGIVACKRNAESGQTRPQASQQHQTQQRSRPPARA